MIAEIVAVQVSQNFGYLAIAYENGLVKLFKMPKVIDPVARVGEDLTIVTELQDRWADVFEYKEGELKLTEWSVDLPYLQITSKLSERMAREQIPYQKPKLIFTVTETASLSTPPTQTYDPASISEKP